MSAYNHKPFDEMRAKVDLGICWSFEKSYWNTPNEICYNITYIRYMHFLMGHVLLPTYTKRAHRPFKSHNYIHYMGWNISGITFWNWSIWINCWFHHICSMAVLVLTYVERCLLTLSYMKPSSSLFHFLSYPFGRLIYGDGAKVLRILTPTALCSISVYCFHCEVVPCSLYLTLPLFLSPSLSVTANSIDSIAKNWSLRSFFHVMCVHEHEYEHV